MLLINTADPPVYGAWRAYHRECRELVSRLSSADETRKAIWYLHSTAEKCPGEQRYTVAAVDLTLAHIAEEHNMWFEAGTRCWLVAATS